jgi:hypothetical protein
MPGPLAVAAYQGGAAVARYVAKHGVKKAAQKYGKAAVKKTATKGNAVKGAVVAGEGTAVKAVNSRRSKAKAGKKKISETRANVLAVAETKVHESGQRAAKQKADYDRREAAKAKPAAKKKTSISVKKNKTPLATKIGKARDKIYKPVSRRM